MKKIIPVLLSLLFMAADASETNFYAKIFGGANFLDTNYNNSRHQTGYVVSGSLGYEWCGFHLEGEYAYRRNDIKKIHFAGQGHSKHGHFETSSIMANLLWDLPCDLWNLEPFIGGGIGYDYQKAEASNSRVTFHQKWRHFSWQLMAGVAYPIYCNTDLTLEYQFHQGGCHFNNHSIGVGLVYRFGL